MKKVLSSLLAVVAFTVILTGNVSAFEQLASLTIVHRIPPAGIDLNDITAGTPDGTPPSLNGDHVLGDPVVGAVWELFWVEGDVQTSVGTRVTDEDGRAVFGQLQHGFYLAREVLGEIEFIVQLPMEVNDGEVLYDVTVFPKGEREGDIPRDTSPPPTTTPPTEPPLTGGTTGDGTTPDLPVTGGLDSLVFTLIGLAMIAISVAILLAARKRKEYR